MANIPNIAVHTIRYSTKIRRLSLTPTPLLEERGKNKFLHKSLHHLSLVQTISSQSFKIQKIVVLFCPQTLHGIYKGGF
ncbi:MAG TPA: hypothetical protein VF540_10465, partial [Segetibacter sp.]